MTGFEVSDVGIDYQSIELMSLGEVNVICGLCAEEYTTYYRARIVYIMHSACYCDLLGQAIDGDRSILLSLNTMINEGGVAVFTEACQSDLVILSVVFLLQKLEVHV